MIAALIRFSLIQRLMILLAAGALVAGGLWAFRTLPIDAFPDITSPQVQVIAKAPGMAPSEVETRITFPIEMEMQGLPRQTVLRSTTKYALAVIVIDFEDGTAKTVMETSHEETDADRTCRPPAGARRRAARLEGGRRFHIHVGREPRPAGRA